MGGIGGEGGGRDGCRVGQVTSRTIARVVLCGNGNGTLSLAWDVDGNGTFGTWMEMGRLGRRWKWDVQPCLGRWRGPDSDIHLHPGSALRAAHYHVRLSTTGGIVELILPRP